MRNRALCAIKGVRAGQLMEGEMSEQAKPVAVTAIDELFRSRRTLWAIQKLLYGLEEFVEVRGSDAEADAALKDMTAKHDLFVEWMTPVEGERGPLAVIKNVLREHPELWVAAMPEEVCIVPRALLKTVCDAVPLLPGLGDASYIRPEMLETHGNAIVDGYAGAQRHYREMNEREEDRQMAVRLRELFSEPRP